MCFVISWPFSICVCFVIYLEVEAIYVTLAIVAIAYFDSSLHSSQIETLNAVLWNWPPVFMTLYLHPFQQLQHFPFNTVVTTSESFCGWNLCNTFNRRLLLRIFSGSTTYNVPRHCPWISIFAFVFVFQSLSIGCFKCFLLGLANHAIFWPFLQRI